MVPHFFVWPFWYICIIQNSLFFRCGADFLAGGIKFDKTPAHVNTKQALIIGHWDEIHI